MSNSKGRPPLAPGEAREVRLAVRVRRGAAERFMAAAKKRGLSLSDAHREALAQWTVGNER